MGIINELAGSVTDFARTNPLIFFGALAIIAFLIYRRPIFFLSLFGLGLLLVAVVYIIMEASSFGVSKKERMIRRDTPAENIFRRPGPML